MKIIVVATILFLSLTLTSCDTLMFWNNTKEAQENAQKVSEMWMLWWFISAASFNNTVNNYQNKTYRCVNSAKTSCKQYDCSYSTSSSFVSAEKSSCTGQGGSWAEGTCSALGFSTLTNSTTSSSCSIIDYSK